MPDLRDALELLHELDDLRDRAKELREQGRLALVQIKDTGTPKGGRVRFRSVVGTSREEWISSGNTVEVALLVKVQNHQDMCEDDETNNRSEATSELKRRLMNLDLKNLFQKSDLEGNVPGDEKGDRRVPVLVAARSMQALVKRSASAFSRSTMLCYYRIVRELYVAAPPDWTIGAARAGSTGTTAFVTGECIRAIFAFEDAMRRTANFFQQTQRLLGRYQLLSSMLTVLEPPSSTRRASSAMDEWADKSIERMWFDWHNSTNPRGGNMALHLGKGANTLLFDPAELVDMKAIGRYLAGLKRGLQRSVKSAKSEITRAKKEIEDYRRAQGAFFQEVKVGKNSIRKPTDPKEDEKIFKKRLREYDRAESAHKFALSLIEKADSEGTKATLIMKNNELHAMLEKLADQFREISDDIHKVLEPAKRYIRTVLYREVASAALGRFDPGELVFAAASYGTITKWQPSELLARACTSLCEVLPENGRLPTTRPFHSTSRGHRMLPIGCEMMRSLAQLFQKSNHDIGPNIVRRMLNIFEEKVISLDALRPSEKGKRVAWNFDGSPDPERPSVWVTAVSVLAIDRVVRMLNARINSIVLKHFEVIVPEKPHTSLTLNDLVYPDHGLSKFTLQPSIALRLEQMRAHVMRVSPPQVYKNERGTKESVFSAIFYGPPGTGKTTLMEALALSSLVPLIRLSPSDLVVQGPAAIEGRARAVFEALSMLTQVVIILDEFEDVVGERKRRARARDEKIFEFLRMAMLPKLVKLNDSAKKQSFAYCLATNYFKDIDPAAKRKGRFDVHIPVYHPDPISRAGLLLYRLYRLTEKLKSRRSFKKHSSGLRRRFLEIVKNTRQTHASSLASDYLRLPDWVIDDVGSPPPGYKNEIPLLWYVLTGDATGFNFKKGLLNEETEKAIAEAEEFRKNHASIEEDNEIKWLDLYEGQIEDAFLKGRTDLSLRQLWSCLRAPSR